MSGNSPSSNSLLVVGSIAYDSVETPHGKRDRALGGSASYAAAAASYFVPVRLVGAVGDDFDMEPLERLAKRRVDLQGIERKPGKTFFWAGRYSEDMNDRATLDTQLNVFAEFNPRLPEAYRDCPFVFLANIDPEIQSNTLEQVRNPKFTALDTMNLWIETRRDALMKVIEKVDLLLLNDSEARLLCGIKSLPDAAADLLERGPSCIVVKKGEHGLLLFTREGVFALPAVPLARPVDPTGAGDAFAGAFMGHLAREGAVGLDDLKRSAVAGTILASFCVEDFSLDGIRDLAPDALKNRFEAFKKITRYGDLQI